MQLKLRTPSGWEVELDVNDSDTVGAVKSKMYEANDAWLPGTQRYVCNGSVLSDDGASLASAGVKPGATIYVVKKLSSLSEATAEVNLRKEKAAASKSRSSASRRAPAAAAPRRAPAASSSAGAGTRMRVQCPATAAVGSTLTLQVPGRGNMRVVVPPGVIPGRHFEFIVPPTTAPAGGSAFSFTIPANARSGQTIHVTIPGRGPVAVTIPANATAGQVLRIRV